MPRRNRAKGARRTGRQRGSNALVRTLVEYVQGNELKRPPRVPDIQRIRLSRNRHFVLQSTYFYGNVTLSTTAPTYGSVFFTPASITDYSSAQTLFDTFKVLQLEVQFVPRQVDTNVQNPLLYTVIDYDDANLPTSSAQLMQYDTCQISQSGVLVSRVLHPKAAIAAYTGAFTGYAQSTSNMWFDCASTTLQFYGVKYATESAPTASVYYELIVTATVAFRSNR